MLFDVNSLQTVKYPSGSMSVQDCQTQEGKKKALLLVPCSYLLEKAMAPHSSTLAWKIPWAEEPGGLQFMGSLRVRHD